MILQAHISRRIGSKKYVKHVLVIPPDMVKKLGWEAGREISAKISGGTLILK